MEYDISRVMKVQVIDRGGELKKMLTDHQQATNEALRFYRKRIRLIAEITNKDRQTKMMCKLRCNIERKIKRDAPQVPKNSINLTTQNSVGSPLKEFLKRKGNRKRPPRYRRKDLRLRENHVQLDLSALVPNILIGFQKEVGRGVDLKPFRILVSQRYLDHFEGASQGKAFMTLKNGRIWLSLIFNRTVVCIDPKAILGLDAGMYSNKSVWIGQIMESNGNIAYDPLRIPKDKEVTPKEAANLLVAYAKKHNAGISIEELKSLNRKRSGLRFGIPTSQFTNALKTACENHAIPLYQINPRGTSSKHHACRVPLIRPKDDRGWDFAVCLHCWTAFSADENAAINIAQRGWEKVKEI